MQMFEKYISSSGTYIPYLVLVLKLFCKQVWINEQMNTISVCLYIRYTCIYIGMTAGYALNYDVFKDTQLWGTSFYGSDQSPVYSHGKVHLTEALVTHSILINE